MRGKTVIVTGANSGIGKATAAAIVRLQGRVIMACRDTSSAQEAAREIAQQTGADSTQLVVKELDLASLTSVRTFCQDIVKVTAVLSFRRGVVCFETEKSRRRIDMSSRQMSFQNSVI